MLCGTKSPFVPFSKGGEGGFGRRLPKSSIMTVAPVAEIIAAGVQWVAAAMVLVISVKPVAAKLCALFKRSTPSEKNHVAAIPAPAKDTISTPTACSGPT